MNGENLEKELQCIRTIMDIEVFFGGLKALYNNLLYDQNVLNILTLLIESSEISHDAGLALVSTTGDRNQNLCV